MQTILVTGGAGFIGSHLCKKLLEQNNKVICLDNLFTGDKKNIEHLLSYDNFSFIEHNIVNPLDKVITNKIDKIYNLACPASPIHYQLHPIETVKANTIGVINILELAKKYNTRVLQTSTSEVYGDPQIHPQTEDYRGNVSTTGPRACYDEGKRVAETLFFDYHKHYNLDIRVARIFNTYGPKMQKNDGRVVSNFIVQALSSQDITIYGNGSQTRSFCYIDDMVSGLTALMEKNFTWSPVNLGNPNEITILETAQKIIELIGSTSKIVFTPLPQDDPTKRKPDISLAKEKLNWRPSIELEEGLKQTIDYFKMIV